MRPTVVEPTLWGHPKGLFYLFFAELWERFSFYGMRALLILYMTQHLLYQEKMSFGIYAAYGSLVYATPLLGGYLADRLLGYRKSIVLGGILMALGHFVLTIDHSLAFFTALGLLIVGNGFFKPNISSFVGDLYAEGDDRRESGFTIFYMGINIGGWLAPLLCGWLGLTYGWHYGFGLAGIGMLLGLLAFQSGIRKGVFGDKGGVPDVALYERHRWGLRMGQLTVLSALLAVPLMALMVRFNEFEHYLVWLISIGILLVLIHIYRQSTELERGRLLVVVYFTLLACLFWAVFEQAGSSLTLFAERNVHLKYINASQSNSLNSFFIILLALPFSILWNYLSSKGRNPSSPLKLGVGLALVGCGFLVFGYAGHAANAQALVPMFYLVAGIFIYTVGEMFFSPIGLAKVTDLSPKKFVSFLMGVWFLSSFYGHYFAGKIAKFTAVSPALADAAESRGHGLFSRLISAVTGWKDAAAAHQMGPEYEQLYAYVSVFAGIGLFTLLIGCLAILISPWVKKKMGGIH